MGEADHHRQPPEASGGLRGCRQACVQGGCLLNLARVNAAIFARINADSGLSLSAIAYGQVPDFPNVSPEANPVLVIGMSGAAAQDHSAASMIEVFYDITIVSNRNALDPDVIFTTRDRLYGDGAPGNPTYGLHNHKLNVTSANDTRALTLLYDGEAAIGTNDPDNLVAHTMRFRVLVESV